MAHAKESSLQVTSEYADARTESGASLRSLAAVRPVLLVFLRHWGCPFCRQALHDLSKLRAKLEAEGTSLVFVHMGTPERGKPYFDHYDLASVERISDPGQRLYHDPAFALARSPLWRHLTDPRAIQRFLFGGAWREGLGLLPREDLTQMPGVFLLDGPNVVRAYRYTSIADEPDYLALGRPPRSTTAA